MSDEAIVPLERGFATASEHGAATSPKVVVVPPLGVAGGVLDPFVHALAAKLHVIVVELPGAGRASEVPPVVSTRELGASVARVIAEVAGGRCHLVGISLGAMIAEWTAIDAAASVDRLVLVSAAARGLDVVLGPPSSKLGLARSVVAPGPTRLELVKELVSDHVAEDPEEMARIAEEVRETPRDDAELAWLAAAAALHDARERLGEVRATTLELTGENDELVPPVVQRDLAGAIPSATQVVVRGAAHAVTLDQPEESARLVSSFLLGARA